MRLTVCFLVLLAFTPLQARDWIEGTNYYPIQPAPPHLSAQDKVEVIEFFWWGCPHCRDLEPHLHKWLESKPEGVEFIRVPVLFGGPADYHAQVFYALQTIGEEARLTPEIFTEIHARGNKLRSAKETEAFLASKGVDMEKFQQAMNSFTVKTKVNRARALMNRFNIKGVPALVVDGRYRSGRGFTSYGEVIEVTEHLVDKVREQRAASPSG